MILFDTLTSKVFRIGDEGEMVILSMQPRGSLCIRTYRGAAISTDEPYQYGQHSLSRAEYLDLKVPDPFTYLNVAAQ